VAKKFLVPIESTVATGTAPLTIASTTAVTNLNSDLLDGQHGSYYLDTSSTSQTKSGNLSVNGNFIVDTNVLSVDATNNRVGIGTASPSSLFNVVTSSFGEALFERTSGATASGYRAGLAVQSTTTGAMVDGYGVGVYYTLKDNDAVQNIMGSVGFQRDGLDSSGKLYIDTYDNGANYTRMVITSIGNAGIGTQSPSSQLHVVGSSASKVVSIVQGATSQTANLQEWQNSSGTILNRIDASGRMGIGVNPTFPLHISSGTNTEARIATTSTSSYAGIGVAGSTSNQNAYLLTYSPSSTGTQFGVSKAGLSALYSNNQPLAIGTQDAYALTLGTSSSARLTIDSAGNVGIGNQSPSYLFDVSGNIRSTGQFISSVATGTAPFAVASTTVNTNLNADLLDGQQGTVYLQGKTTASDTAPSSPQIGDGWYDTNTGRMYIRYDGYWVEESSVSNAASIQVGTVTTIDSAAQATVTNSGTTQNAVLNFRIPRGAQGAAPLFYATFYG
jgi:hypothetical protein